MTNRHSTNSVERLESIWKPGLNSQFFRSPQDWETDPRARVHGHQLRRAWDAKEGLGLWAVLCVDSKPAVYFKRVDRKQPEQENEWQRRLWNQGTAMMLVVQDPQEVRVYSGLARPDKNPAENIEDARLVDILDYATRALELANFIRSVETGQFYRDYPAKFNSEQAVDKYLLENLGEARDQLCDTESDFPLPPSTAHAFLGRCLFISYLLERGIIGSSQLRRAGARGAAAKARNLQGLLSSFGATDATSVLYGLFRVIKDDFNGSMFGGRLAGEKPQIRKRHIDVLSRFLSGDEMKTGQRVLFPLYDFRFIPIEFISAVYEDFLAVEHETPDSDTDSGGNSKRRKVGAYYTPPRLAELVVDVATEDWDTLLHKRYLDPACGSGIFLVILFQRMAEEWRRKNPSATNIKRARALRAFLTKNLCGVDVNETACMVACFSLYLAFMDQFDDPRDIWELATELKRMGEQKVLPLLMIADENGQGEKNPHPAIHVANFFGRELPELIEFDLAIGNPPWVGRNQPADVVLEKWVLNEPKQETPGNPFIKWLDCPKSKADRRRWFFPNRQSANAFMWKAPLHVKSSGTICLLLPSKVLLANQIDDFQSAWFRRFQVDVIWQLADYSFILFAEADCPATIVRYHSGRETRKCEEIRYITPKVTALDPRDADIPILPEDNKVIALSEVLDAADRTRAFTVWKKHFWGTHRDQELINRLMRLPTLQRLAGQPHEGKRFIKGQGFKPFDEKKYAANPKRYGEPKARWWEDDSLFLDAKAKGWNWFLLDVDCAPIGKRWMNLHRGLSGVFRSPAVILNQGFTKFAFVDFPVLFRHSLQTISGRTEDTNTLLFLTAVLNSPLATYFLFHTSANWGIERDKVLFDEVLSLPFPLPEDTNHKERNSEVVNEVGRILLEAKLKVELTGQPFKHAVRQSSLARIHDQLLQLVYEYYSICDWERVLIEETLTVFEPSSTPTPRRRNTETQRLTKESDRHGYADLLCSTLNGWLSRQKWKLSASVEVALNSGLGLLTINRTAQPKGYVERSAALEFENVLTRIQKVVSQEQGGISYARGFVFFEPEQFHILKPLTLRHWTKTSALNDADALMGFMATRGERQ